ncbi:MAG: cell division protein ZapA [Dysosmobacter welbionis]
MIMGGICPAADQSTDEGEVVYGNRVVINICGRSSPSLRRSPLLTCSGGAYVNDKMAEVLDSSKVGRTDAAVLTAVNIADELFKAQAAAEQLRGQIKGIWTRPAGAQSEASELKREVFRLQAEAGRPGPEGPGMRPELLAPPVRRRLCGRGPERRGRGVPGLGRLQRP